MTAEEIEILSSEEKIALIQEQAERIVKLELLIAEKSGSVLQEKAKETKPSVPAERVERNGKLYRWTVAGFKLNGKSYKSAEASLDENVIDELISLSGQRVLVEVK